jgi:hypothetical protein
MHLFVTAALLATGCGDDGSSATPDANVDAAEPFCNGTPRQITQGIVRALTTDNAGNLLAVATQFMPQQQIVVIRLLPDGTPDPAFGTDGIVRIESATVTDGRAIAIAPDNTLVVGGGHSTDMGLAPFVVRLMPDGQPAGAPIMLGASMSASSVERLWLDGSSIVFLTSGVLRRMSTAGVIDTTFGTNGQVFVDDAVTRVPNGYAVASRQLDSFNVYRLDANGMNPGNVVMVAAPEAWQSHVATSRADRVTFFGTVTAGINFDLVVGRVEGTTGDAVVVAGVGQALDAFEMPDDSILVAADSSLVVLKPDRTLDHRLTIESGAVQAVTGWGEHRVVGGTLSGGIGYVACE